MNDLHIHMGFNIYIPRIAHRFMITVDVINVQGISQNKQKTQ